MSKAIAGLLIGFFVLAVCFMSIVSAENHDEINVLGLDIEEILLFVNAWLAVLLFILAFVAYKRDGRERLLFVSIAFLLFAIKNFLMSSELFFPENVWIDPLAIVLEFLVLLSFFFGVLKK